jgi:hypothetical protein
VDAPVAGAPPDGVAAGAGVEGGVDVEEGSERPQPVDTNINMTANVEPRIFGCRIGTSKNGDLAEVLIGFVADGPED